MDSLEALQKLVEEKNIQIGQLQMLKSVLEISVRYRYRLPPAYMDELGALSSRITKRA